MKKACMKCKSVDNEYTWEERYEVSNDTDSEKYLSDMIDKFNRTLRPKESAREIVNVWEEPVEDLD